MPSTLSHHRPATILIRGLLVVCIGLAFAHRCAAADADSTNGAPAAVVSTNDTLSTSAMAMTVSQQPTLSAETNSTPPAPGGATDGPEALLVQARYLEKTGQAESAESILVSILANINASEAVQKAALFDLGAVVRLENDLPRAESICAQFIDRWTADPQVPEVILREGQIYRQMGLNSLALTKFYAVMTTALSLKSDRKDYYPKLVLEAQIEIAETHYLMGRYNDAADFYSRLLKQNDPALNRPQTQFRLVRSLIATGDNDGAAGQAEDFLSRFPDAPEQPEIRYYLSQADKKLGHNAEALQQVLLLLQEEKAKTADHPDIWAYWQQRAGNEVANQLYSEGDYVRALDIYINLAQLDPDPSWQLPVKYQIGLTYERLLQPERASETYTDILKLESQLGTNATPGQLAVFDMARWRTNFVAWQAKAQLSNLLLAASATNATPATLTQ